jgi:hypothetical protein
MGITLPARRLVGIVRVMTTIKPRCMVLNMVYNGLFCFISPWFSLTLILNDFSSVLFAAFREMSRQTEQ